jgi:hypothetical protein
VRCPDRRSQPAPPAAPAACSAHNQPRYWNNRFQCMRCGCGDVHISAHGALCSMQHTLRFAQRRRRRGHPSLVGGQQSDSQAVDCAQHHSLHQRFVHSSPETDHFCAMRIMLPLQGSAGAWLHKNSE